MGGRREGDATVILVARASLGKGAFLTEQRCGEEGREEGRRGAVADVDIEAHQRVCAHADPL